MCTSPVQPICTFSCTAHFISLHILPLILFHYLFLTSFSPYLYIYIYSLVFLFHSFFYCFYVIFILLSCFIFLSCTFHWADLSWLTFHYLLYPVWLCMWQIIKNLEPWRTLTIIINEYSKIYKRITCCCTQTVNALKDLQTVPKITDCLMRNLGICIYIYGAY